MRTSTPPLRGSRGPRRGARALVAVALTLAAAAPAVAQRVLLAFGDSITAGFGDDRPEPGYPPRLQQRLVNSGENVTVLNFGLGGETTVDGLSRINSVLEQGGDVLLLMEGTNDINYGISTETTLFNLDEMARRARAKDIETVHATIIPRKPTARFDPNNRLTGAISAGVRDLAWSEHRGLVDPFEVFISVPNIFEDYYYDGPEEDRIGHPNSAGYDLLADAFADVLLGRDTVPPVPGAFYPADGAKGVSPRVTVSLTLYDFQAGINFKQTSLTINGEDVPAEVDGDETRATFSYGLQDQYTGTVALGYRAEDFAQRGPNRMERVVSTFALAGDGGGGGGGGGSSGLPGDFDGNGRVDGADLIAFALRFGAAQGEGRYDPLYDLDGDGVIDGNDLAILASNFGTSAS